MNFEHFTPIKPLGSTVSFSALGVPPGVSVQPQLAELLRDVTEALSLPEAGIVTPWAGRQGDLAWKEIQTPDTNVALFQLTDAKIAEASNVLFGAPLPFVAVFTDSLLSISELERIAEDSPYDLFETQAVYRQSDQQPVPKVFFLHWLRVKDEPDIPRDAKNMDLVAQQMRGKLVFGQQVPVEGSTIRQPPSVSFEEAFRTEPEPVEEVGPAPGPLPAPEPVPTQPPDRVSILGPLALGVGALAATVAIGRAMRK